jgi:hypothetical protein
MTRTLTRPDGSPSSAQNTGLTGEVQRILHPGWNDCPHLTVHDDKRSRNMMRTLTRMEMTSIHFPPYSIEGQYGVVT